MELNNLSVKLGKHILLKDVSFSTQCGQITAVIGENGAGKTTLLRAILGDVECGGDILYLNHENEKVLNLRIGYVPQQFSFDRGAPLSVRDFLTASSSKRPVWLGAGRKTRGKIKELLEKAGCPELENRPLGQLSGGELQRVMLALALNPQPDLLLLDEPVSGVDHNGLDHFFQTLSTLRKQNHMAILLVSHDWALVKAYADRVILLGMNILTQGTPDEVFASNAFKKRFGEL